MIVVYCNLNNNVSSMV